LAKWSAAIIIPAPFSSERFMRRLPSRQRAVCLAAILSIAGFASGCVSRRMMVYSDPPGALVLLEGKEVGYTPVAVDFLYYGTREITLIKDGYETKTVLQRVPPPWYQWPVIEFFADNFAFHNIADRQSFHYSLEPRRVLSNEEVLSRGEMLRSEAQIGP
jgi:hypothetical protein